MTADEIREVVRSTLTGLIGEQLTGGKPATSKTGVSATADCCVSAKNFPLSTFHSQFSTQIPLEVSARHVHLTQEALDKLFGSGTVLEQKRMLSQPGEFLSDRRVNLVTNKGELDGVAVLGPARNSVQLELAASDCRRLGIDAPVNLSGDLSGASDVTLKGSAGEFYAKGAVIVAKNHIHCSPVDADRLGVADGQTVSVRANTARPVIFENVPVRVSESFALTMHIDTDEANACGYTVGSQCSICGAQAQNNTSILPSNEKLDTCFCADKVITELRAKELIKQCGGMVKIAKSSILTPSAKDIFLHAHVEIERV